MLQFPPLSRGVRGCKVSQLKHVKCLVHSNYSTNTSLSLVFIVTVFSRDLSREAGHPSPLAQDFRGGRME